MPVESFSPPPTDACSRATSPGAMPVSGVWNWLPFGQKVGNSAFHVAISSCGVTLEPASATRYVFCHIFPKPWIGETTCLPEAVSSAPAGMFPAASLSIGLAQLSSLRVAVCSSIVSSSARDRGERVGLVGEDRDRLVEPCQLEDLA